MSISFMDLFAACERSTSLLRRLAPREGCGTANPSPEERAQAAASLLPLLARLGDFADDHGIDDGPLCEVRTRLSRPPETWHDEPFGSAVEAAVAKVRQIKAAIHLEGHRQLRSALMGT